MPVYYYHLPAFQDILTSRLNSLTFFLYIAPMEAPLVVMRRDLPLVNDLVFEAVFRISTRNTGSFRNSEQQTGAIELESMVYACEEFKAEIIMD